MARPRAADYDEKRTIILEAAARLFARDGFPATTMQNVAQACGTSKSLLYHYWPSKEALLDDVLASHLAFLLEQVQTAAAAGGTPRELLHRLVARLLDAYSLADDRHEILLRDLGCLPPERQEAIRELERRIVRCFADAIRPLSPVFAARPELLKPVTMSLLGMLNWHHRWHRPDGAVDRATYAALAADLLMAGVTGLPAVDGNGTGSAG